MYLLIIFFISLIGAGAMIGRKVVMLRRGEVKEEGEMLIKIPPLSHVENATLEGLKIWGDALLVVTVKMYVQSVNLVKSLYGQAKSNLKKIINTYYRPNGEEGEKEVSKFLKMISTYKNKIRKIKHKIK